jgi:hypothetical protein
MALYEWSIRKMRATSTSDYWHNRPSSFQLMGWLLLLMAIGIGLHFMPPLWPDWLRWIVAVGTYATVFWGGRWLLRRLGFVHPS